MTKTNNITGERIHELRDKLGLYQSDMAARLKMQRNNISRYENGVVLPPIDVLSKIATILNTTTDYLLGNTDNPAPIDPEAEFDKDIDRLTDDQIIEKYKANAEGRVVDDESFRLVLAYLRAEKRLKN